MEEPLIPIDEASRIDSLYKLDVLDTPAEERFDRITRLAKRMFDVPIVLISLVDKKRQWFKSRQGLEPDETSRKASFCAHAITRPISTNPENRIMEVPDTALDQRFVDNPLVVGSPNIRFYAGFILQSHDEYNLGTLCLIDRKPRQLSANDKQALFDMGMVAQNALQSLRHEDKDLSTGLYNRRGFLSIAEYKLENCSLSSFRATLVYFKLSDFVCSNGSNNQLIESDVLSEYVDILKSVFRKQDLLARIGEDQFVVLMVHHVAFCIETLMEQVKTKIEEYNSNKADSYQIHYDAGVITSIPEYLEVSGRLLDLVDKRIMESNFKESFSSRV